MSIEINVSVFYSASSMVKVEFSLLQLLYLDKKILQSLLKEMLTGFLLQIHQFYLKNIWRLEEN